MIWGYSNWMKKIKILLITTTFISTIVFGQSQSFRCKFSDGLSTDYKSGKPISERDKKFNDLVFDQLNSTTGKGRMIGNNGVDDVQVLKGDESIHVIEITMSGNMNITTIFNPIGKNSNDYPVVHSRQMNLFGKPIPSQYVGFCKKLD